MPDHSLPHDEAVADNEIARLKQELADYRWLFDTAEEAVIVLDMEANFIDCSRRYWEIYGFDSKEQLARGYPANVTTPFQPDGRDSHEKAYECMQQVHEKGHHEFEWLHRRRNGEEFLSFVKLERITFGGKPCIRGVIHDISAVRDLEQRAGERVRELAIQNRELEALSFLDPLTGVYNRRKFDAVLPYAWDAALRADHEPGILFVDIDFFKLYNDHYGHAAGDACLKVIADRIAATARRKIDFVVRYGGEEFVVITPDVTEPGLLGLAEAIRQQVEAAAIPHAYSPVVDHVTVSIGCSLGAPAQGCQDVHALLDTADRMLYQAKKAGRNRIAFARCGA